MMQEMVHVAMVHVAVHVAEQGGQKCEALSRPMSSDPETGCPNDAAMGRHHAAKLSI